MEEYPNIIGAISLLISGALILVFRNYCSLYAANAWNRRYKIKVKAIWYKIMFSVVGTIFVIVGILAGLGIINFK